jgi:hypothetical protein
MPKISIEPRSILIDSPYPKTGSILCSIISHKRKNYWCIFITAVIFLDWVHFYNSSLQTKLIILCKLFLNADTCRLRYFWFLWSPKFYHRLRKRTQCPPGATWIQSKCSRLIFKNNFNILFPTSAYASQIFPVFSLSRQRVCLCFSLLHAL